MRRALIFVHFDRHDILDLYCRHLFSSLARVCSHAVFVSSAKLSSTDIKWAKTIAQQVIVRENQGYDFMSYKCGLDAINREGDEIPNVLKVNGV